MSDNINRLGHKAVNNANNQTWAIFFCAKGWENPSDIFVNKQNYQAVISTNLFNPLASALEVLLRFKFSAKTSTCSFGT